MVGPADEVASHGSRRPGSEGAGVSRASDGAGPWGWRSVTRPPTISAGFRVESSLYPPRVVDENPSHTGVPVLSTRKARATPW
jgi:hypothetical protein